MVRRPADQNEIEQAVRKLRPRRAAEPAAVPAPVSRERKHEFAAVPLRFTALVRDRHGHRVGEPAEKALRERERVGQLAAHRRQVLVARHLLGDLRVEAERADVDRVAALEIHKDVPLAERAHEIVAAAARVHADRRVLPVCRAAHDLEQRAVAAHGPDTHRIALRRGLAR